jgi:hypothetical protein
MKINETTRLERENTQVALGYLRTERPQGEDGANAFHRTWMAQLEGLLPVKWSPLKVLPI